MTEVICLYHIFCKVSKDKSPYVFLSSSASAILNMPYVKEHLSSFIEDTESLHKQRSSNDSMATVRSNELSVEGTPVKISGSR